MVALFRMQQRDERPLAPFSQVRRQELSVPLSSLKPPASNAPLRLISEERPPTWHFSMAQLLRLRMARSAGIILNFPLSLSKRLRLGAATYTRRLWGLPIFACLCTRSRVTDSQSPDAGNARSTLSPWYAGRGYY